MAITANKSDFNGDWQRVASAGFCDIENRRKPQQNQHPAIEYITTESTTAPSESLIGHVLPPNTREPFELQASEELWVRGPENAFMVITAEAPV